MDTPDDCLIGDGVRYDFNDEYIVAGDVNGEEFYLFNRKGKFIRAIGGRGGGPEEFVLSQSENEPIRMDRMRAALMRRVRFCGLGVVFIPA